MNRFALIAVTLLTALGSVLSQQPTLEWAARYHNTFSSSRSLSVDKFGNIFISGFHISSTRSKFITLKYNTSGVFQWASFYQGPDTLSTGGGDDASKNIADGSGNVYVAGRSSNYLNGAGEDILVIKYDTHGNRIWSARYNGPGSGNDVFADMVIDKFANVYITGTTTPVDFVTLKYDSTGTLVWEARYNNTLNSPDYANAIAIDSSGNIYVTGYSGHSNMFYKYTTVKYNQSGIQQWVREFSTFCDAQAISIAVDTDKNVAVTGLVDYQLPEQKNYLTIKYDSAGNQLWAKEFNRVLSNQTGANDIPFDIKIDNKNYVIVIGTSIVKYDPNGNYQWSDSISPGYTSSLDDQNNLYVVGGRADTNQFTRMQTIKYTPMGNKLWVLNSGGAQDTIVSPSGLVVDMNNNIYISGNTYVVQQNRDSILLFKYSQPIGIISNNNQIPERFNLYQNYPNPFNPVTKIKFDVPASVNYSKDRKIELIIYDVLGKEISKLINTDLKPGKYEYEWSAEGGASNFASGIYFYTLKTNSILITKKMLMIK